MLGHEYVEAPEDMQGRLLDEVLGVEVPSRGRRQPAVRPAFQRWKAPLKQGFHSFAVTRTSPQNELNRRLVAQ